MKLGRWVAAVLYVAVLAFPASPSSGLVLRWLVIVAASVALSADNDLSGFLIRAGHR